MVKEVTLLNYNIKHQRSIITVKVQEIFVSSPDQCDHYRCFHSPASWKSFKLFSDLAIAHNNSGGKSRFSTDLLKKCLFQHFRITADLCQCFPSQIVSPAAASHGCCVFTLPTNSVTMSKLWRKPKALTFPQGDLVALPIGGKEREAEKSLDSLLTCLFNFVAENTGRTWEEKDCSSNGVLLRYMKSSPLQLLEKPIKV